MFKKISYWLWKRKAKQAVVAGKTATCCMCDDPIIPGDFVGIGLDEEGNEVLMHAGFHFSLSGMHAYCETAAVGCGTWNGNRVAHIGESSVSKAFRTGEIQMMYPERKAHYHGELFYF
jgi:hypothetical protein